MAHEIDEEGDLPEEIKNALLEALRTERPVTIGVIGVSGVGKSSLINRLFRTEFATSATIACTKEFTAADVELSARKGPIEGAAVSLRVIDAPGLGESRETDPGYLAQYRARLPECDAIIWVSAARNRAAALEQEYLEVLKEFHPKMVFGLGQADLVDPLDWNERFNLPSETQEHHLSEIAADRAEKFAAVTGSPVEFIPFSARRSFNLQLVFTALVERAQRERGWLLSSIKGFEFDDWMTDEARRVVEAARPAPASRPAGHRLFHRPGKDTR
ncbi:hypothetical protein GCM10022221_55780 [Actinocorallia aurea]